MRAYGLANRDFGVPNRRDTKFNLGSANQNFTAVIIALLVEAGKLSWEDPLSRFLPDFPDSVSARKVRIKHLLSHTSGLGSYFNRRFMEGSRARFRTVDDFTEFARPDSLRFEPGTRFAYSYTGYLVLGKVIEVVEGRSYFAVVRERIYRPLGMTSTDAYDLYRVNPNLAVGYLSCRKRVAAAGDARSVERQLFRGDYPEGGPWRYNVQALAASRSRPGAAAGA